MLNDNQQRDAVVNATLEEIVPVVMRLRDLIHARPDLNSLPSDVVADIVGAVAMAFSDATFNNFTDWHRAKIGEDAARGRDGYAEIRNQFIQQLYRETKAACAAGLIVQNMKKQLGEE